MARTLTAANAIITFDVPDVFDTPFQLQQFQADDMFDTEDAEPVEVRIGVDGFKSSGFTPFLTKQTYKLMADSITADAFEIWLAQMKQAREDFTANATIVLPGVGKVYTCTNGSLSRIKQTPEGKKVLEGQVFEITWADVDMSYL
jgi:hypothetical protein